LVIEKPLARHPAIPLHEAATKAAPDSGLGRAGGLQATPKAISKAISKAI
jgi:hypothetical protein